MLPVKINKNKALDVSSHRYGNAPGRAALVHCARVLYRILHRTCRMRMKTDRPFKENVMEYSQLIKDRYSVRKLGSQSVEEDKVKAILEAARVSPTAVNKQPQRLLVLRSPESMAKLKECTPYSFGAPMAIAVCCNWDEAWVRPYDNYNSGVIDAAVVGTHIMLAVHDLGLGSTWVGHFDPVLFREKFNLPENIEPVVVFPIGYPAPEAKPAHLHAKRRPLEETVVYESF